MHLIYNTCLSHQNVFQSQRLSCLSTMSEFKLFSWPGRFENDQSRTNRPEEILDKNRVLKIQT